jgi:hypothetical protein
MLLKMSFRIDLDSALNAFTPAVLVYAGRSGDIEGGIMSYLGVKFILFIRNHRNNFAQI